MNKLILEYRQHRNNNGALQTPNFVENGGYFPDNNNTFIGVSSSDNSFYIDNTVKQLSYYQLEKRVLSLHANNPFKKDMSDTDMTEAEVLSMVNNWAVSVSLTDFQYDIATLKEERISEMYSLRDVKMADGFSCTIEGTAHSFYNKKSNDINMILGAMSLAKIALDASQAFSKTWITSPNRVPIVLDAANMIKVGQAMADNVANIMGKAEVHAYTINTLTTIDNIKTYDITANWS